MALPATLESEVQQMRSAVERADMLRNIVLQSTTAAARNIAQYVVMTPVIETELSAVLEAAAAIGIRLNRGDFPVAEELEPLKTTAARAIDGLERRLTAARPNEMAAALGLDW